MARKKLPAQSIYDHDNVVDTLMRHDGPGTVRELSRELGITAKTFNLWMKERAEFASIVRSIRSAADDRVEAALFDRAVGYAAEPEVTQERNEDGELVVTKQVLKHVAPDVGAAKHWLAVRRPEEWTERKVLVVESGLKAVLRHVAETLDIELSPEDWKEIEDE
jgi:hypothetical protein